MGRPPKLRFSTSSKKRFRQPVIPGPSSDPPPSNRTVEFDEGKGVPKSVPETLNAPFWLKRAGSITQPWAVGGAGEFGKLKVVGEKRAPLHGFPEGKFVEEPTGEVQKLANTHRTDSGAGDATTLSVSQLSTVPLNPYEWREPPNEGEGSSNIISELKMQAVQRAETQSHREMTALRDAMGHYEGRDAQKRKAEVC
eukprot:GHVN01058222.1.p1 GENE.GHVN01058222.1~~GHVN01058222.1.p1  ORF type:complete len:196 (+),score=18.86 GHVN01058222.1:543-1130(+)